MTWSAQSRKNWRCFDKLFKTINMLRLTCTVRFFPSVGPVLLSTNQNFDFYAKIKFRYAKKREL